jgi:hypothetical protein
VPQQPCPTPQDPHGDFFGGHHQQATQDEARIFARLDHACCVIECGIRVAAPDRFLEGAGHFVMPIALPVVIGDPAGEDAPDVLDIERVLCRDIQQFLDHVEKAAPVTTGLFEQGRTGSSVRFRCVPQ